jgi:hypothetical protein
MYRIFAFALGLLLIGSQIAFSQTAPVKYLAGKSESGQPHLYWFGAAAAESTLYYDDGTAEWPVYVSQQWADNQVLVRFGINIPFFLVTNLSTLILPENSGDTSTFALSVRKDTGSSVPGSFMSFDTVKFPWNGQLSAWVEKSLNVFLGSDTSFWGTLHWFAETPADPFIGEDRSGNSGRNFVGFEGNFSPFFSGGNRMIRAKVLINNPSFETADSFWVYRGTDSISVSYAATGGLDQFDFLDAPTIGGDYYYRVTRWQGSVESPPSNAVRLTASPTAVEDKQIEKHAFLLSEPFPNPTSASVVFSARTDKQMPLGFSIYNLLGQKVFAKPATGYPAGEHPFFWNGQDVSGRRLSSGMYLLRFQAGEEVLVKKITLLR